MMCPGLTREFEQAPFPRRLVPAPKTFFIPMDKEIAALLQRVKEAGRTPFWQSTPETARGGPTLMRLLFGDAPAVAHVEDLSFTTRDGSSIGARLYIPSPDADSLIVFFHGGGWVIGSVADYHPFTARLACDTGCAVLSVDYRLAPEHSFPRPVEDAQAALAIASREGGQWLGKPLRRLVAMGDSAGGTLATVATRLHGLTNDLKPVDLQVLAYPVTDANFETNSYQKLAEGFLLTRRDMQWFWDQYCPDISRRSDPEATPISASDLSSLPPTVLLCGTLDPLLDEGRNYGHRLSEAGVPVKFVRCEGLVHGFLAMINYSPTAGRAYQDIVNAIRDCSRSSDDAS